MRYLLPILFFAFSFSLLNATTHHWFGGTGKWHNPKNWSPYGVPTHSDQVIIEKGHATIYSNYSHEVNTIDIHSGGTISIQPDGTLNVLGPQDRAGILNHGFLNVDGELIVSRGSGSWSQTHGIENHNEIRILGRGELLCADLPGYAIDNQTKGNVFNEGAITSMSCGGGIDNRGFIDNHSEIFITGNTLLSGIVNRLRFINRNNAEILITDLDEHAIINMGPNNPLFQNYSNINIFDANICISVREGSLVNYIGGTLTVTNSDVGISIGSFGELENRSVIISEFNNIYGIRINNLLTNFGTILTAHNPGKGLFIHKLWTTVTPTLKNFGDIQSVSNGTSSIELDQAVLLNMSEGILYTDGLVEGDFISNLGILQITGTGPHNVELNNYGVVQDLHNSVVSINNESVVIRPITQQIISGVPINNALEIENHSAVFVLPPWQDDMANATVVGDYHYLNNTFTPNDEAVGLDYMFVLVNINASGLNKWIQVNIGTFGGSLQKAHGEYARDLQESISKKYTCYPNPSNGNFTIEGFEGGHVLISDMDGKTVWEEEVKTGDFRLEGILDNGSYQVVLTSETAEPTIVPIVVQK